MPNALHIHGTFLPPSERWAARLVAHTRGFDHYAVARHRVAGLEDTPLAEYLPHGLEVAARRVRDPRVPRATRLVARARLAAAGGLTAAMGRAVGRALPGGVDIVHAHFADVAWEHRVLASKLSSAFVVSFYGWDYEKLPFVRPAFRQNLPRLFALADAVVAEGPYAAAKLRELGCPGAKTRVVPLGTDLPPITTSPPPRGSAVPTVLQLAGFAEKKGQLVTLSAFERVARELPDARLLLVGGDRDADYSARVRRAVADHPAGARIEVREFVRPEALAGVFAEASVFCQPSQYAADRDCEGGAPVALLDAQAAGLPCVGTTHCDLPYVIAPLSWNAAVDPGDAAALATRLIAGLRRDASEVDADTGSVRRHVAEHFDVADCGLRLAELYASLLRSRTAANRASQ